MPKQIGDLTLYEVPELAELLGVQEKTVRAYLRDGRLQGRKLAKKWYVSLDALKDYFNQPEDEASSSEGRPR
jgi:excisionase family DNA binding protein